MFRNFVVFPRFNCSDHLLTHLKLVVCYHLSNCFSLDYPRLTPLQSICPMSIPNNYATRREMSRIKNQSKYMHDRPFFLSRFSRFLVFWGSSRFRRSNRFFVVFFATNVSEPHFHFYTQSRKFPFVYLLPN